MNVLHVQHAGRATDVSGLCSSTSCESIRKWQLRRAFRQSLQWKLGIFASIVARASSSKALAVTMNATTAFGGQAQVQCWMEMGRRSCSAKAAGANSFHSGHCLNMSGRRIASWEAGGHHDAGFGEGLAAARVLTAWAKAWRNECKF